ncbi:MAG: hypothetical protein ABSF45_17180 [Terriglobia bacterium]
MSKPGIDQLLIESALQLDLRRRLLESPEEVFRDFDLTEEEKDILRRPDHRLLELLGATLARQMESAGPAGEVPSGAPSPPALIEARTLPDTSIALTVVPCALYENGQLKGINYVVWANPMPEGGDPASLPPPAGVVLPGRPLAPLYAVIQLSAVQTQDAAGNPQVGLWAWLQRPSNVAAPPPPETAGVPEDSPFGSRLDSGPVQAAVAAVRKASREERYGRLIDLMRVLRSGDVR